MRNGWKALAAVALMGTAGGWGALEPPVATSAVVALVKQFEVVQQEAIKAQDRDAYFGAFEEFKPKFEALLTTTRGTADGLKTEIWLASSAYMKDRDGAALAPALKRLIKEYPKEAGLAGMIEMTGALESDDRNEVLEALVKSPHRSVQAEALLTQARAYGSERDEDKQEEAKAKSKTIFLRVLKEYADVQIGMSSAGAIADANLYPHPKEALQVGVEAPEIVGIGQDGKSMTLSKYRGKVVLLDFWGDW